MKAFTEELIAICRLFGLFERESICCGTVTVPQCVVLQELLAGDSDVSTLAGRVGGSVSAMTRLLDGLERKAWVARGAAPEDRRRVVIRLTEGGREEARRLRTLTERAVSTILARIPAEKQTQCLECIQLLRQALSEARDCQAESCSGA